MFIENFNDRTIYTLEKNKYKIYMMITNKCNLNCFCCDHFCPIVSDYWFLEPEEIRKYAKIIKEKMPNLNELNLFGGEPFLHPNILEICKILRSELPNLDIIICTNGLLLFNLSKDLLNELHNLNIDIICPVYENIIYNKEKIKEIEELINIYFIDNRAIFFDMAIDLDGAQPTENFFNCYKVQFPFEFHMYKNKIYSCATASCMEHIGIADRKNDYIDIFSLKNEKEMEDLYYSQLESCKYCKKSGEHFPWHRMGNNKDFYLKTLKEYYLEDYPTYNMIMNNDKFLIPCYQDDLFRKHSNQEPHKNALNHYDIKFFNGLADIYIPFNQNINNIDFASFKKNIQNNQEKYKNCNLYFVSINAPKEQKEIIYHLFKPLSENLYINSWLFEANSYEEGLQIIKENSYTGNIIEALF